MRFITVLAAAVAVIFVAVGVAIGGTPDGTSGPWADSVVSYTPGLNAVGTSVLAARSDPTAALGPAESVPGNDDPIPNGTFVSLGYGGALPPGVGMGAGTPAGPLLPPAGGGSAKEPTPAASAEGHG